MKVRETAPAWDEHHFAHLLLRWAALGNLREFPWRIHKSPYPLLIVEIMLRRTRADQVRGVYLNFLAQWPTLADFLRSGDDELREALRPLGLAWRAENLLALRETLKAVDLVPDYDILVGLPGVGDYVASAICCFAGGETRALVDTNSVRVLGRYFGFSTGPETRRRRFLKTLAASLVPPEDPATYNYAILDLAATICRPTNPDCGPCPLACGCALAQGGRKAHAEVAQ